MSGAKDITSSEKRIRKPTKHFGNVVPSSYSRTNKTKTPQGKGNLSLPAAISSAVNEQQSSSSQLIPLNQHNLDLVQRARSNSGQSLARSSRSLHSTSKLLKAKVDLEAQTKQCELNKECRKYERIIQEYKSQIDDVFNRETELTTKLTEGYMSKEERESLAAELKEIPRQKLAFSTELEYAQEQLISTQEAITKLALETEIKKNEIQLAEDEELDRRSEQDKMAEVESWANASAKYSNSKPHDTDPDSSESDEENLSKKFSQMKVDATKNNPEPIPADKIPDNYVPKVQPKPKTEKRAQPKTPTVEKTDNPYNDAIHVLAAAINAASSSNTSNSSTTTTDKLLARQIHGRDLPPFYGNPGEWALFISTFETSTKNCKYSNAENLVRLQRCLRGEAKQTVQSLLVSEDNVPKVIEKLKKWFGRPDLIINAMLTKTRSTPPVKSDKPETLVELGRTVDNLVTTVISLQQNDQLSNPLILKELVEKLPRDLQLTWSVYVSTKSILFPKLDDFSSWFDPYVQGARLLCTPKITSTIEKEDKGDHVKFNRGRRKPNERAMVSTEKTNNKPTNQNSTKEFITKSKCIACEATDHRSYECKKFKEKKLEERWDIVKKTQACSGCLGRHHVQKDCRTKRKCGIKGCEREHNRLLHSDPKSSTKPKHSSEQVKVAQAQEDNSSEEVDSSEEVEQSKMAQGGQCINYLVIPVRVKNSAGELVPIHLALDSYSSLTAISAKTAKYLGITGTRKSFTVNGFQSTNTVTDSYQVNLEVHSKIDDFSCIMQNVRTVPNLNLEKQSLPITEIQRYKHLRNLPLEPYSDVIPTILVGMDNYELHLHHEVRLGKPGQPAAARTALGWTVVGKLTGTRKGVYHSFKMTEVIEDPLHQLVQHFFATEAAGVEPETGRPRSREDARAQKIMDNTIKRVENGWETGLLWREEDVRLPKSKDYAMKRLYSMERKMDKDPVFAKQYCEHVDTFMQKGFAKILTPKEAAYEDDKTFYLPHFMAFNAKKANKYRFVFDAAAKINGQSLNSHLLQGPDKLASLVGILLRFRQRKIAITADIKDFFPRVKVRKEDVNAQRFLWRGMDRDRPPDVCRMDSLIFGAACSPACAQEAKEKNAREYKEEFPKAYEAIAEKHYVDDYLDSVDTEEEAIKLQQEVTNIQAKGGFQLCNWLSNSSAVLEAIPKELHAKSIKAFDGNEEVVERVLGLFWRPETDDFTFQMKYLKANEEILKKEKTPTKRQVLSLVMSIFDCLGFVSILTVKAKLILQMTWRSKIGWDDDIPRSTNALWKQWLEELSQIETFSIPRCYSPNFSVAEQVQLHVFCDGSEEAYGAVAYFRISTGNQIETSLVMSKSNVSPLKPLSIPRIELQASLKGAKMSKFITQHIDRQINRIVLWTDSFTVLRWIRADGRRFKQFVATRLGKIQTLTDIIQWKWVPTELNVADELTRFAKPCDWSSQSRWINGPLFLKQAEEHWPMEPQQNPSNKEDEVELKKEQIFKIIESNFTINSANFSSWGKLVRTTAYVLRFGRKLKKIPNTKKELSVGEIKEAETVLLKLMQKDMFAAEFELIKNSKIIPKSNRLSKLSPAIEDFLLVVKGRLDNANALKQQTKRPIIIDPKHPYMRLLLDHFHRIWGHHGQERIANEIRQQYYVMGLRVAVRSAQHRCQLCKNRRSHPQPPEMGQLPSFRLSQQTRPFIVTGLDYFGPIEVIVKRSREKRYVALFTCLSTRAVHLELAGSLNTDSCIMAIRRFIARRGTPVSINSDNGTNFVGANNELKIALKEIDQEKLNTFCLVKSIEWNFNPPSAPHMGGSWERMVRAVKVALGDTLQQKNLHEEVLHTVLVEAEHTVNSHPLTHVPDDPNDIEALTPNHFLIGKSSNLQPIGEFRTHDLFGRQQWRITQTLANHFWKRWVKEYLPSLLRRDKWCQQIKPIAVGDVVVEVNNANPRNCWPKGRVTKLFPGKDGVVRVVDIALANGHVYRRPVAKLCILDVQNPTPTIQEKEDQVKISQLAQDSDSE